MKKNSLLSLVLFWRVFEAARLAALLEAHRVFPWSRRVSVVALRVYESRGSSLLFTLWLCSQFGRVAVILYAVSAHTALSKVTQSSSSCQ